MSRGGWPVEILAVVPESQRSVLLAVPSEEAARTEEIRLRSGRPIEILVDGVGYFPADERPGTPPVTAGEIAEAVRRAGRWSVYALEEELRLGYITLPGGHRMGLAGRILVEGGRIRGMKEPSGINLRIAREKTGIALPLIDRLRDPATGTIGSVIILSPPGAGKTTLLRDLVRSLSEGLPARGLAGTRVTLVDERSEVAATSDGMPGLDVGRRTDVLDGCPKAEGMLWALRSLSPTVLAVDEIGRREDSEAIMEAALAGVTVLATAHARSWEDFARRGSTARLAAAGIFRRAIVLSRRLGPGTVETVLDTGAAARGRMCSA